MYCKIKDKCTICNEKFYKKNIINLKNLPITEILNKDWKLKQRINFDQSFMFCSKCIHANLKYIYDFKNFYKNNYTFSSSTTYSGNFTNNKFYNFIINDLKKKKFNILEVGSNDFYLIKKFDKFIKNSFTVDPSNSADLTLKKNTHFKNFIEEVDKSEIKKKIDIVFCGHTLEHVENPRLFFQKLFEITDKKTVFYFKFPSVELLLKRKSFDQIHHQHYNYFSLKSITKLLNEFNFKIVNFSYCEQHYGALMIKFKKSKKNAKLNNRIIFNKNYNLSNEFIHYKKYLDQIKEIILNYKKRGYKTFAIGAGLMLPIIDYHLDGLISKLDKILDDDKKKINKYFPNIKTKIKNFKAEKLENAVTIITTTASTITTRKLISITLKKKVALVFVPSLTI